MSQAQALMERFPVLAKARTLPLPALMGAAATLVALIVVLLLWSRGPDYRVLFSNLEDRDGAAIVTALTQMNVPYKFSETGTSILVPEDRVHEARLQLAGQGLPRGGGVGFELLDQTRFGASEFTEQVNYQRALEGELANSIQSVHAVQQARVHLAIPRETLFVRDRQEPTASVLVTLYPGRTLSPSQVSAITWLVSSSVPNLAADRVSVVDQNGRLLTNPAGEAGVDGTQRTFVHDLEHRTVQRILTLLTPLVGPGNVRAQASADVDFSQREQTSEVYRPNQEPGQAAIRSQQTSNSEERNTAPPIGVPGALTNQPPVNATAPIIMPPQPGDPAGQPGQAGQAGELGAAGQAANAANGQAAAAPSSARHDATINYEVDRTISHIKDPMGKLRRLSVAVVVNYQPDETGAMQPLPPEALESLERLVRDAMGYSAERGDTVSVVNSPFTSETGPALPVWEDPKYIDLALEIGKYLLIALMLLWAWRKFFKPIVDSSIAARTPEVVVPDAQALTAAQEAERRASEIGRYEENLNVARELAEKDPRAVAMVLRSWMEKNGKH